MRGVKGATERSRVSIRDGVFTDNRDPRWYYSDTRWYTQKATGDESSACTMDRELKHRLSVKHPYRG